MVTHGEYYRTCHTLSMVMVSSSALTLAYGRLYLYVDRISNTAKDVLTHVIY